MDSHIDDGILAIFVAEAEGTIETLNAQLDELKYGYEGQPLLDAIYQGFHTLYGGAAILNLADLAECANLCQQLVERLRKKRISASPSLLSTLSGALGEIQRMCDGLQDENLSASLDERLRLDLFEALGSPILEGDGLLVEPTLDHQSLDALFAASSSHQHAVTESVSTRARATGWQVASGERGYQPLPLLATGAESNWHDMTASVAAQNVTSVDDMAAHIDALSRLRQRLAAIAIDSGESRRTLATLDGILFDMHRWLASQ